jgi:hypothetical protein
MENTNVISDLKFLGNLKPHNKINTKFLYVQEDGVYTRFMRTFINHDNRQNTLKFIHNTVSGTFGILEYYQMSTKSSDRLLCMNIIKDLEQAKIGLSNLIETYNNDLKFKCDIELIIQNIDAKMLDIKSKTVYDLKLHNIYTPIPEIKEEDSETEPDDA